MGADVILARGVRVEEHTTTVDHVPVFYRSASETEPVPVLYLHEALTSSDDFLPFLERGGGIAPDLIGFGRSGKGGHLDYTPEGMVDFLDRFVEELGLQQTRLVGHGWGGALGLLLAQRRPGLVTRLVLIDPVPLLEGFTWHGPARIWRRPLVGEMAMGSTPRWLLERELRRASTHPEVWSSSRLSGLWAQFDQGTQRALLRLHRAADESRLAQLGDQLGSLAVPTLVLWGEADPWFDPQFADAYGARLANAQVARVPAAGHW
ncbi:MAG: alpha/beta hydrolase, partial [Solirubrobacterales bacterium]|nr:alpha/beta hydrolase [Solirubrobacterales bacterium]